MSERMARLLGDASGWETGDFGSLPLSLSVLATNRSSIFHEGPVLFSDRHKLYFTTNRLAMPGGNLSSLLQHIDIMTFDLQTKQISVVPANIPMPNGMSKSADGRNLLVCSQGYNDTGGAIVELNLDTLATRVVVSGYLGRALNSPNDVAVASNGDVFFTDPVYGFQQGFRAGPPKMGNHVYRYRPGTDQLTLLSDDLLRPNGIALWEEAGVVFVSDSGFYQGPPWTDGEGQLRPNSIYAVQLGRGGAATLGHAPKVLGNAARDVQDGLAFYEPGRLLFAAGNGGIEVWDVCGSGLLGLIYAPPHIAHITQLVVPKVPGRGTMYVLSETALWSMDLDMPGPSPCGSAALHRLGAAGIPAWGAVALAFAFTGTCLGAAAFALSLRVQARAKALAPPEDDSSDDGLVPLAEADESDRGL